MRFILINPSAEEWRAKPGIKPYSRSRMFRFSMLTSLSVAASLPPDVEVRIIDEETEVIDFDLEADLIGISCMTFNAPRAYEIADIFRSQKGKKVILGGFHPTFLPDEALKHCDAVCIGEAEKVMPQIIQDFQTACLRRKYQADGVDLSTLVFPQRQLVYANRYLWADPIQATRGCRNTCTFCSITAFHHNEFRQRPIANVLDELRTLKQNILFLDDNLTTDPEYAKELFTQMIPLGKKWSSQCCISICNDDELLELARKSGCIGLFIGLESISQVALQAWKKDCNKADQYRQAIQKLHDQGMGIYAGIVLGTDDDDRSVFANTLEFLLQTKVDALQATIMTPFPGTPLYDKLDSEKRITDKDWSHYDFKHVVFEPKHMAKDELCRGHQWILNRFYSRFNILGRVLSQFSYLPWQTVCYACFPLNLSYRFRLSRNGILGNNH